MDLLPILLTVALISLTGVMLPGPMFAVAVAKSYQSPWAGTRMSLGHAVVEVPLILAIYFGLSSFDPNPTVRLVLSLAGGTMVVWLGIHMFRARAAVVHGGRELPYGAFVGGIVMTALNPAFLLWWATTGAMLIDRVRDYAALGPSLFIIVHWGCDLVWLSLVSVLIFRTRSLWGTRFQEGLFVACSLLLAGFGVWFIVSGIQQAV
jgi:threonine/homoserine/homoserine lactone efflux protein